jgi:hypothetical protein
VYGTVMFQNFAGVVDTGNTSFAGINETINACIVGMLTLVCSIRTVHDGADLKNKLMGVMVYFQPAEKINKSVMHLVHEVSTTFFKYSINDSTDYCITSIHT